MPGLEGRAGRGGTTGGAGQSGGGRADRAAPGGGATVRPAQGATTLYYPEAPLRSRAETPKLYGLEADCTAEDSKVTKETRIKRDQARSSSSVGSEGRGKRLCLELRGWRL